jgi:hypothetical protein
VINFFRQPGQGYGHRNCQTALARHANSCKRLPQGACWGTCGGLAQQGHTLSPPKPNPLESLRFWGGKVVIIDNYQTDEREE